MRSRWSPHIGGAPAAVLQVVGVRSLLGSHERLIVEHRRVTGLTQLSDRRTVRLDLVTEFGRGRGFEGS